MTQMSSDHLWGSTQVKTLSRTNEYLQTEGTVNIKDSMNQTVSILSDIISDMEECSCLSYDFFCIFLLFTRIRQPYAITQSNPLVCHSLDE